MAKKFKLNANNYQMKKSGLNKISLKSSTFKMKLKQHMYCLKTKNTRYYTRSLRRI